MIIQCDKCATRFRLDDSRITPNGVKVRCTKCDNVFIVTPPPPAEEVLVEELFGVAPGDEKPQPQAEKSHSQKPQTPKRKEDDRHLAFDFDTEVTREDVFKPTGARTDANGDGFGGPREEDVAPKDKKLSLDDLDFSFSEDRSADKSEQDSWGSASAKTPEEDPFAGAFDEPVAKGPSVDDDETGFGEDITAEADKEDKTDFDFGFEAPPGEDEKEDAPSKDEPAPEKPAFKPQPEPSRSENVIPFSAAAYTRDGKAPSQAAPGEDGSEVKDEPFNTVLSRTMERDEPMSFGSHDEKEEEENAEAEEEEEPDERKSRQPRMGVIIAALIIVLGGGLIYYTGIIDKLTSILMPPSEVKVVEIESIKGFYEENKNFGKLFVIDARVKNITGEPQEVKAATGIVYNDSGDKIAEKSVSPGRIVSIDDVRNLSKEELERAFRDPSGGVIPARGSVPVMVLFLDVPEGISEFGVDIVR